VLGSHSIRPTVGLEDLVRGVATVTPHRDGQTSAARAVMFEYGRNANPADVTPYSKQVLEDILRFAGLKQAVISSTSRNSADQARVMFNNLELYGVEAQKKLYGPAGDKVIDVYAKSKAAGKKPDQIKLDMEAKIKDLGPTNVSKHASDPKILNVFDVAPSSIKNRRAFEQAVKEDKRVARFLTPAQSDPGYHLEIPQKTK
jgi:hypothetical protein